MADLDAYHSEKAGTVATGEKSVFSETGETASIDADTEGRQTQEQTLAFFQVDTSLWEVVKFRCGQHSVSAFDRKLNRWCDRLLWNNKLELRRKIPKKHQDACDWIVENFKKHKLQPGRPAKAVGSCMLEPSLCDAHFGRYAWSGDCGTDWDTDIACRVYENAISDLLNRVKGWPIAKIVLPVGNDFFHVNNWLGTTVNNTPQDVDTRFSRVYRIGYMAVARAVQRCREVAPVEVLYVPGNHDRETSFYLCFTLEQVFERFSDVTINVQPKSRKYTQWGCNLLGFTHGDEEKHRDLPAIMAAEEPQAWSETTHREIHLGHFHRARQTVHQTTDEFGGVRIRVLPSLSGSDSWHYRKGYVGAIRAAEGYLWDKVEGYVAHYSVNARES